MQAGLDGNWMNRKFPDIDSKWELVELWSEYSTFFMLRFIPLFRAQVARFLTRAPRHRKCAVIKSLKSNHGPGKLSQLDPGSVGLSWVMLRISLHLVELLVDSVSGSTWALQRLHFSLLLFSMPSVKYICRPVLSDGTVKSRSHQKRLRNATSRHCCTVKLIYRRYYCIRLAVRGTSI